MYDYDLIVIGSGPAGHSAAIQAAKINKRVALIEESESLGGNMVHSGTIPSKTLREAVLYLTGYREHNVYGDSYSVKKDITMNDLLIRTDYVIQHEIDTLKYQLSRNHIDIISAQASFISNNEISLNFKGDGTTRNITAEYFVIAVGTHPSKPTHLDIDNDLLFLSDDILNLPSLPKTLSIIGGGPIGLEYASIFATLGVRVTLIDKSNALLKFMDSEIVDSLKYEIRKKRITLRLNEEVDNIQKHKEKDENKIKIILSSGKQIISDKALYTIERSGNIQNLNLENAKVLFNKRGQIEVDSDCKSNIPNIYAAGDIIGFPSLASTSKEQGRLATCHAFNIKTNNYHKFYPYGIYTIPEISMVGSTEEELTEKGIPYEIGKSQYKEIARGQIIGDDTGILKLIFHIETRKLLGVHILGEGASELIHIGQSVLAFEGTIDYFIETVFNYPTLAECYKHAAFDGINKIS